MRFRRNSPFADASRASNAVVIIGGGPSIADIDLGLLSGHRFIVSNSGCRVMRAAATELDVLYFTDNSWFESHRDDVATWPGMVISANRHACVGGRAEHVDVLGLTSAMGASPDYVQASSGHISACVAAVLYGAKRILLIGFECGLVAGKSHGHDDYVQGDTAAFRDRFIPGWNGLAPAFRRLGVDVLNATPQSALMCFPKTTLEEALAWR